MSLFKKYISLLKKIIQSRSILMIVIAYGLVLLSLAGDRSFWLDELYSVYERGTYHTNFYDYFQFMKSEYPIIPFYEFTLYAWMKVFGSSETAVRSLSILMVCGSGFFTYLISQRFFNKRIALLAMLLFLMAPQTTKYALEARYYGQMMFLTTLSSLILFNYMRNIGSNLTFSKLFRNKYFILLTLVNFLVLLNHTFNYLFFFSQAVFMFFWLTFSQKDRSWPSALLKGTIIYSAPFLLMWLVWPPTFHYIFNKEIISSLINTVSLKWVLALLIIWPISWLGIHLIRKFKNKYQTSTRLTKPKTLLLIYLFAILGLFSIHFGIIGITVQPKFNVPALVFYKNIFLNNFTFGSITALVLAIFILLSLYAKIASKKQEFNNYSRVQKNQILLLLYSLSIITLSCTLLPFIYFVKSGYPFNSRYLLFCVPPLMVLVGYTLDKWIPYFLNLVFKQPKIRIHRTYLKFASIFILVVIILGPFPKTFRSRINNFESSWSQTAKDIIDVIHTDPEHSYYLIEAAVRPFPTLDFYLQKNDSSIKIDNIITTKQNKLLKREKTTLTELLSNQEKESFNQHDYLIISFTHWPIQKYKSLLKSLDQNYSRADERLKKDGNGFLIWSLNKQQQ